MATLNQIIFYSWKRKFKQMINLIKMYSTNRNSSIYFRLHDDYDRSNIVLQLIDFGQSIDMKLFPSNQVFYSKLKTENFICTEMLDNRPWNYQHDLYCLAATIYTLVCGKYMSVKKMDSKYTTTMPRYCKRDLWMPIFDKLINIRDSKSLPNLLEIIDILDQEINKLEQEKLSKQIIIFNKSLLK